MQYTSSQENISLRSILRNDKMYEGTLVQLIATGLDMIKRGYEERGREHIRRVESLIPYGWKILTEKPEPSRITIWAWLSRFDEFGHQEADYSCVATVKPSFTRGLTWKLKARMKTMSVKRL